MNIANKRKQVHSRFLRIPMINNKFMIKVDAVYNGESITLNDAILDTGCSHSHITYREIYVFMSEKERLDTKRDALKHNSCTLSYGTESPRSTRHNLKNMTLEDKVNCSNIKVLEKFSNLRIHGVPVGDKVLGISYDYDGTNLIGMEILKDWDIHISKSLKTGQTLLIACPLDKINQEYINALIEEFDVGQQVIKKLTDKIDYEALAASCIKSKLN